jgi:hypothetical protein
MSACPCKAVDVNGDAYVSGIFNPARTPAHTNHYCHVKLVLDGLNVAAADMGTLEARPSRSREATRLTPL